MRLLHRRLAAGMGIAATVAFIAGAGFDSLMPVFTLAVLTMALFWAPPARVQRKLDYGWRIIALVLAARALYHVLTSPEDIVLPMVDLLLLLLASETWRESGAAGDTRVYSLSFALLIAASAYRPGLVFAVGFIVYVMLAAVALMVGHVIRRLSRHKTTEISLDRPFLWRIAALSSVMLVFSAIVFTAFPRVSRNWMMRTVTPAVSVVGFSDRVSIGEHGGRITSNPEVVLRVEFPDIVPQDPRGLYWRGRSYDYFDGVAWSRSPGMPRTLATTNFFAARWPGERITQRIFATMLDVPVIFGLHPVIDVQSHTRMRPLADNAGDLWYYGAGAPSYSAVSVAQPPSAQALRSAYGEQARGEEFYLQLPNLPDRIHELADSLTRDQPTRFDSVRAVQHWLRNNFRYTLELPATPRQATLDYFLFNRRAGHCEYFSTALAVLLRSVGIPARNVNGFLGGTWNEFGQFLTVTQNEAHSWVEVWFPRYGWVTFDATPAATTDIAQQQLTWYSPLRTFFDGFEHRWNKWVLEYDLDRQTQLFRRAAEPFIRSDDADNTHSGTGPPLVRWLKVALLFSVLALAVLLVFSARRSGGLLPPETRAYLQLRRAYERAGYRAAAYAGPLNFLAELNKMDAPGLTHAQHVIDLYLRARFSAETLQSGERAVLNAHLGAALAALRRRPAGPSKVAAAA